MPSSPKSGNNARKPHLVFISYYFPPMGGGGVQRVVKFLKYINNSRFETSLLTVKESYFYAMDPSLSADLPATVSVLRSGSLDPFRILSIIKKTSAWFSRKKNTSTATNESSHRLRQLANSVFVPDSRVLWLPFALLKLRRLHRHHTIDILVASMPPFTCGLIGILAKKWLGIPCVLDYRDSWRNNPYLPQTAEWLADISHRMENYCLSHADAFIFVNPVLASDYQGYHEAIQQRPSITIRNGFDPDDLASLTEDIQETGKQQHLTLGIMGSVYSQGNSPLPLLRAIAHLKDREPDLARRFRLTFLGKWTADFPGVVASLGIADCVEWIGYLAHRDALRKANGFDALAVAIEAGQSGGVSVTPGRIYEYLALKKPVLAMCPVNSDLASLVRACDAGEVLAYSDIEGITGILQYWISHPKEFKERYRHQGVHNYSRRQQAVELMDFLETVIGEVN